MRLSALTIFFLWAALASAAVRQPLITFKTDDCPNCGCMRRFIVEFYPDGKVHWFGKSYVHAKGHHYAKISIKKLRSYEKKLIEADFFNLPVNYLETLREKHKVVFDRDPNIIIYRDKSIRYYGYKFGIEKEIYDYINTKRWLEPTADPWESGCVEDKR